MKESGDITTITHLGVQTRFVLPHKDADHIQRYLATQRAFYEADMLDHMRLLLEPDSIVLDVGAYIGTHSLYLAKICGARVFAFEASPKAFSVLEQNVAINEMRDRVSLFQVAVGACAGRAELKEGPAENLGQTQVVFSQPDGAIETVRLDDLAFPGQIAAIKIDVEGSELEVLRGAEGLLRSDKPLLFVECATLQALDVVARYLLSLGYGAGAHHNATPTIVFHPAPPTPASINVQLSLVQHAHHRKFEKLRGELLALTNSVQGELHATQRALDSLQQAQAASVVTLQDGQHKQLETIRAVMDTIRAVIDTLSSRQDELLREIQNVRQRDTVLQETRRAVHSLELQLNAIQAALSDLLQATQRRSLTSSPTVRKVRKLLRNPDKFLADSKHDLLRVALRQSYSRYQHSGPVRKLAKLRRRPQAFFRDSDSRIVRSVGKVVLRWSKGASRTPEVVTRPSRELVEESELARTTTSVVVVLFEVSKTALEGVGALAQALGENEELVVVAPPSEVGSLGAWASVLSCARAHLFVHYASAPTLQLYASYGLERAHGEYVALLCDSTPEIAQQFLAALRRHRGDSLVGSDKRGRTVFAATSRDLLRAYPWSEGDSFAARSALERASRDLQTQLQLVTIDEATFEPAQPKPQRCVDVMVSYSGQHKVSVERLLARDGSKPAVVYSYEPSKLQAALNACGGARNVTIIDASAAPSFFVCAMPSSKQPFRSKQVDVVYMGKRPAWAAAPKQTQVEKVTVIMTSFNSEATIDTAVESILSQSHQNLELIIVDDCSTDGSLEKARSFAKYDKRVRVLRSHRNQGTYWCRNYAIANATGKYVTFHDSDDVSLGCRIELELAILKARPDWAGTTVFYQRMDEVGRVVWVGGYRERTSRLCLMVKRSAFQTFGFFDSVRVAADEEFMMRVRAAGGRIKRYPVTMYFARYAHGSLTSSGAQKISIVDGALSEDRQQYVASFTRWHDSIRAGKVSPRVAFPLLKRPFDAPDAILPDRKACGVERVTASMASMPSRIQCLEKTVKSLLPQVDVLNVYLNNFDDVPGFLRQPKINVARSQDHGDLRDNGKFFFAVQVQDGYHFTVDDDIEYPSDYVQKSILAIERYGRKAVVGVHGVNLDAELKRYIKNREVFHFRSGLHCDRFVQLLGTGTIAYHTSAIRLNYLDFKTTGVADLWFAYLAKSQGVSLVCQRRRPNWLKEIKHGGETIFSVASRDDSRETELARSLGPWDEASIDTVRRALVLELLEAHTSTQLEASGYDMHTIARIREQPPIKLVLIVPGWNCAEHVEACWRSIVRQQSGHYMLEVILVDDGSTDGTYDVLNAAMAKYPARSRQKAVVIRNDQNVGPAYSRWRAMQTVTDPHAVVALLDMDDELFDFALARVTQAYLADPECWMTVGNWQNQQGQNNPLDFYAEPVVSNRIYRRMPDFRVAPLRTFKRFLAKGLTEDMFKGPDGSWLMYCSDVALAFPTIERCSARNIVYIREPIYLYNERREGGTLARFGKEQKRKAYRWLATKPPSAPLEAQPPTEG